MLSASKNLLSGTCLRPAASAKRTFSSVVDFWADVEELPVIPSGVTEKFLADPNPNRLTSEW